MENETLKTYKNFVDNKFSRSESNLTSKVAYQATTLNVVASTRKDLRNSLQSNRKGLELYAASTAQLKSQLFYRTAENLESRKVELISLLQNINPKYEAQKDFDLALNLLISLAGWPDKYPALTSSVNPVNGSFLNTSQCLPTGVCLLLMADNEQPLFTLINKIFTPLVTGNVVTVIVDLKYGPLVQTLGEVLLNSDFTAGSINLLSANLETLLKDSARHYDLDLIEYSTLTVKEIAQLKTESASTNLKRTVDLLKTYPSSPASIGLFTQVKTIWQTVGY